MMIPYLLILLISWPVVAEIQPTGVSSSVPQSTACGDIIRRTNTTDKHYKKYFAASDVFACLSTVPFNPAVASRFVKYFNDTIQFHSGLAYLRDPPNGYQQPAVDLVHDLGVIQNNIDEGYYRNQYQFEEAVQRLIYSAHDKHLRLNAGILSAFLFYSPVSIVSLSPDGQQAPRIYLRQDVQASRKSTDPWQPSPIQTINGQDAEEFFTRFAQTHSPGNIDPNADWNSLMYSPAQRIQHQSELFRSFVLYPGDSMSIVLDNGTQFKNVQFRAMYVDQGPTGPLETGGDFYNFFVLGLYPAGFYQEVIKPLLDNLTISNDQTTTSTSKTQPAVSPTVSSTPLHDDAWSDRNAAYPDPNLLQANVGDSNDALISGYFIEGTDLAVISIPSFKSYGYGVRSFGEAISEFISKSLEEEKTRIVIDLQRNGGGSTTLAVLKVVKFFPDIDPYMGTRLRAHDMANDLGRLTDKFWNKKAELYYDGNEDNDFNATKWRFYLASSEWLASNRINAETGKTFTSWEEFYGPRELHGDNFTETQRYNYSNIGYVTDSLSHPEASYIVYGYQGHPANESKRFAAENITILTDGLCDSACALFVEMMRYEAGVKSVVAGGRPEPGPMQATGGTRGAHAYSISTLDLDINITQEFFAPYLDLDQEESSLPERINDIYTYSGGVNVRDAMRKDEDVPLQFLYDAADCRIYYTKETLFNQTALWLYAGEALRHPESHCVANSTGHHRLNPPDPVRSPPVGNDTSRHLDAKLKDSIIDLGDEGVQSSDRVAFETTITGSRCSDDDDCKYPDKYTCVSLRPNCKKKICVPRCHPDLYCYSNIQLTGDCVGPYTEAPKDDYDDEISIWDDPVWWGHCKPRSGTYCNYADTKTVSKKRSVSP